LIRFELKTAPHGTTLDAERGVVQWKAVSNGVEDKRTEVFVVRSVGNCGEQGPILRSLI
jgi:hypothetical protein